MLTPERALRLNIDNGKPLPKVPGLSALYIAGTVPRHGEVVMIAGRSGAMKSMFALWFADELALPVLYISADMSPFTATVRVAQKRLHITDAMVEHKLRRNEAGQFIDPESVEEVETELRKSRVQFSFGSPITWTRIEEELDAYVEVHDEYPAILVIDNLMDFEYAETDYHVQSGVMQGCTEMARDTGISPWVLHHATDKSDSARTDPYNPPGSVRHQERSGREAGDVLGHCLRRPDQAVQDRNAQATDGQVGSFWPELRLDRLRARVRQLQSPVLGLGANN